MTSVLIADDHPIMLSGVAHLLRSARYEVVASIADGLEVLEAIAAIRPDVAVLDVSIPGLNGIEILKRLRDCEASVKVVLLTAQLEDDDLLEALRLGVEGIVLKQGGERLLIECLDKVTAGGRWIPHDLLGRQTHLNRLQKQHELNALTDRELEISRLVAQGLRNRSIAEELGLSEGTVKVYLNRVYEKLGVTSRTELVLAMNRGRVSPGRPRL